MVEIKFSLLSVCLRECSSIRMTHQSDVIIYNDVITSPADCT